MPPNRMLIIGAEYPGIESLNWEEAPEANITDYQAVLLDGSTVGGLPTDSQTQIATQLDRLVRRGYSVVAILPRVQENASQRLVWAEFAWKHVVVRGKKGRTLIKTMDSDFHEGYRAFLTGHEIVVEVQAPLNKQAEAPPYTTNIGEYCSVGMPNCCLLHPPAGAKRKEAIDYIVEFLHPDFLPAESPQWYTSLLLADEEPLRAEEKQLISNRDYIEAKIAQIDEKLIQIDRRKRVTLEIGPLLGHALHDVLTFFGIDVSPYEGASGEEDFEFQYKDRPCIIQAKGRESKSASKADVRQVLEYKSEKESGLNRETDVIAILIGNYYSKFPLDSEQREKSFPDNVKKFAEKYGIRLFTSKELIDMYDKFVRGEVDTEGILGWLTGL